MESADELHLHPHDDGDPLVCLRDATITANNITKLTLYNLHVSEQLASVIGDFWESRLQVRRLRRQLYAHQQPDGKAVPPPPPLTLKVLGCTGALDRVLGYFWNGTTSAGDVTDESDASGNGDEGFTQRLIMYHNHEDHFDVSVFVALGMGLANNRHGNNRHSSKTMLRLYQPLITQADMWALAQGLKSSHHLVELDLSSCRFPPLTINRVTEYFAEGLEGNRHLRRLRLVDCQLTDEQMVVIVNALTAHPTLERLDFSRNKCRAPGLMAIVAAFADTPTMEAETSPRIHLDLSNQNIPLREDPDDDTSHLLNEDAIRSWRTHPNFSRRLLRLDLSGNRMNDRDLLALLELLFHDHGGDDHCSTYIRDLFLARNDFTDEGIIKLAGVIRTSSRPREGRFAGRVGWMRLDISRNEQLTRQSLEQIAMAMQFNLELEEVCLQSTALAAPRVTPGPEAAAIRRSSETIQYYTCLNKAGRKLFAREQSDVVLALWPIILARVNHLNWSRWASDLRYARRNALYFLLLEGAPTLFKGRVRGCLIAN